MGGEEGLDIVEEFYSDESILEQHQQTHDLIHVQDIQRVAAVGAGYELKNGIFDAFY